MILLKMTGVIMQQVSCDIKLSQWRESVLDCIQYFTLAISTLMSGLIGKRLVMDIEVSFYL